MNKLNGAGDGIERAIAAMRHKFRDNEWMLEEHWPLNERHVRLMIADVMSRFPPGPSVRLLDVGCFNGYIRSNHGISVWETLAANPHGRDSQKIIPLLES